MLIKEKDLALRFRRDDVMSLDFKGLNAAELPRTLLKLALRGGGLNEWAAEDLSREKPDDPDALYLALKDAALRALKCERAAQKRREQEYAAWRTGWYVARAMGTHRDYPQRP